jgi:hypothetical protein
MEHFGELYDSLSVAAETESLEAECFIDIYGANAGYIGTFQVNTTNGQIQSHWNLVGPPPRPDTL